MSFSVLPPVYSDSLPFVKNFIVGYPRMAYFEAVALFTVASTFAKGTAGSELLKNYAAFAYKGAKFLQCPHLS